MNFQPRDTVTGTITIGLQPAQNLSAIAYVTILNDNFSIPRDVQSPFMFDIDTRWWPNGERDLTFLVGYREDLNLGLRKLRVPTIEHPIPLVFKHAPFPPVLGYSIRYTISDTCLACVMTWTQRMNVDVDYYVIQRYSRISETETKLVFQDTLFSRSASLYSDTVVTHSIYFYYKIGAANEFGSSYTPMFW
jgi:hypothetical protein